MAGIVAITIVVLSCNAVADALLSKKRRVRYPKFSEVAGEAIGGTDEVSVALGAGDARGRHLFEFVSFLVLLGESLL